MDFNNHDGNGDELFGARNENSVLFSLDSLTAIDKDSSNSNNSANPSGDASGLINLNTLAQMSSTPGNDSINGSIPMQSVVFNSVIKKEKRNKMILLVGGIVLVVALCSVFVFAMIQWKTTENSKDQLDEDYQTAQTDYKKLQNDKDNLEASKEKLQKDLQNEQAEIKKLKEELAQLQTQQAKADLLAATEEAAAKEGSAAVPSAKKSAAKTVAKPGPGAEAVASGRAVAKPPAPSEVKKALDLCAKKAQKCAKGGNLVVQFNMNSSGVAKNAKALSGTFSGTPTEKCILTVVEKHQWPTFTGAAVPVKYNFKL